MAIREGASTNACHAVWDGDGGQAATREGTFSDACHAVANGYRSQAGAINEGIIADACHAVWDGGIFATRNQGVCGSFNNGIAVVTGIIGGITGFNLNGGQAAAMCEGHFSDACHAVWDGDGG